MKQDSRIEMVDLIRSFRIDYGSYSLQGKSFRFDGDITLHLTDTIYRFYHCRMGKNILYINNTRDFIEELSQANTTERTWDPNWVIKKIGHDYITVYKDGLTLWAYRSQFIPIDKFEEGSKGYLALPKEFRSLLPGFYMVNSDAPLDQRPPLIRIYWNIKASAAAPLINILTRELNSRSIPFQFKLLSNPNSYNRTDAAVLYINKEYLASAKDSLRSIYLHIVSSLRSEVSIFTKYLADGISLAEDPNNNESFGQHRSRLLAEALKSSINDDDKIGYVSSYMKKNGVDIDEPYINLGSKDDYDDILEGVFVR